MHFLFAFPFRPQEASRQVTHFHFTAWVDEGVPKHTYPLLAFRRLVRSHDDRNTGTMIVHCRWDDPTNNCSISKILFSYNSSFAVPSGVMISRARAAHRTNLLHSARSRVSLVIRSMLMLSDIHFVMLLLLLLCQYCGSNYNLSKVTLLSCPAFDFWRLS